MDESFSFTFSQPRAPEKAPLFRLRRPFVPVVPLMRLRREIGPGVFERFYTVSIEERDQAVARYGYVTEGIACNLHPEPMPGSVPLTRLWHGPSCRHSYTAQAENLDAALALGTYRHEGVTGHVFPTEGRAGTVPLHVLVDRASNAHLYTTDAAERDAEVAAGAEALGVACWVYPAEAVRQEGTSGFGSIDRFYTASSVERDEAVARDGWVLEGIACTIETRQVPGSIPLVRLWHEPSHRQVLTAHLGNLTRVLAKGRYRHEGVIGYVFATEEQPGTVPLYVLIDRPSNVLLYTIDAAERDAAAAAGAEALGIACWVYPPDSAGQVDDRP